MEAEIVALSEVIREVLWLSELIEEIQLQKPVIEVLCDYLAAISTVKEQRGLSKAKHIEIRHHYLRNLFEQQEINTSHIESSRNTADIFTKPLSTQKFNNLKQDLGLMVCLPSGSVEDSVKKSNVYNDYGMCEISY